MDSALPVRRRGSTYSSTEPTTEERRHDEPQNHLGYQTGHQRRLPDGTRPPQLDTHLHRMDPDRGALRRDPRRMARGGATYRTRMEALPRATTPPTPPHDWRARFPTPRPLHPLAPPPHPCDERQGPDPGRYSHPRLGDTDRGIRRTFPEPRRGRGLTHPPRRRPPSLDPTECAR